MHDIHEDIKINNMFTEIIFDLNNLQEIESMTYHINYLKKICKIYMNLSLDEIKQSIERAAEKQHRLANLMSLYTGEFAK